uniref:Uncharacterized protein n=1 Tax=Anopheles coluzzii TaxID=1518534 RepID=A0A8W7PN49_ANOCL
MAIGASFVFNHQIVRTLILEIGIIDVWTDIVSEVPTEFCAWHVYSPASRRPTGRSCKDSCRLAISDRPALRHTILAGGFASATHRRINESLPSSRSICGAPSIRTPIVELELSRSHPQRTVASDVRGLADAVLAGPFVLFRIDTDRLVVLLPGADATLVNYFAHQQRILTRIHLRVLGLFGKSL